jgi:cyclohexanone monooxygenase
VRPDELRAGYDVVVVGAGMGGIYAVHRFRSQGLSVLCLEAGADVGGVWFHNSYPGARVDIESDNYCYVFDPELYREWQWSERYAAQPEILAYLRHAAERYDVRRSTLLDTRVTGAQWHPESDTYTVTTDTGLSVQARYLVMTTGQLSAARRPDLAGLADFRGDWTQTSTWRPVPLAGRRVAVVGTGSSGVQAVTAIADEAAELYVLQRTANYSVPARNGPADPVRRAEHASDVEGLWRRLRETPGGIVLPPGGGRAGDYSVEQQQEMLEERWAHGGQAILTTFSDIGTSLATNTLVADFVRARIAERVADPELAERLMPRSYPIGARRLCIDTGYYETFNRPHVLLVDIAADPIDRVTETGIRLRSGRHVEVDTIVLAIGFDAFLGSLDAAGITNERGEHPSDRWARGPRTYLGLMTTGFPNLFLPTGPGSPGILVNMNASNVHHLDLVGDIIAEAAARGSTRVEPTRDAEDAWTSHAFDVAEPLLRRQVDNIHVHVGDDGSRVFIPYAGGFKNYVDRVDQIVADGFAGLAFTSAAEQRDAS